MKGKTNKTSLKGLLNFIAEAGMLKRVKRSGWSVLGIKNAETVAEHSFRCALIGYILAQMESCSAYNVLLMTLVNDMPEARIGDLHKIAQRYIDVQPIENKSFAEQTSTLPKNIKTELAKMRKEYNQQKSKQSIIARDADILECLLQAKEYHEQGFSEAVKFMQKAPRFLKTKSARSLWQSAKNTKLSDWWFKLSQFKR